MKNVPRYTSYPTAVSFSEAVDANTCADWLGSLSSKDTLSLYLHIPFCKQLCWFCGCHTRIINSYRPVTGYLELMEQEIRLKSSLMQTSNVSHIHFGGGSPSMLDSDSFASIVRLLGENFNLGSDAEFAVEVDPRTVDGEKTECYADCGVNRVSIGVQDFDERVQLAINRVQTFTLVRNVVDTFRDNGINAINLDLIYGLPWQTLSTFDKTVRQTLSLDPDRVSLFGYAHVPWMKKHQKMIPAESLPDSSERIRLYDHAKSLLEDAGYVSVGLDHFAKRNDSMARALHSRNLKRNFQGYTTDNCNALVGFGVSAISSFSHGYAQNISSLREYETAIESGILPVARGVALTESDTLRRDIIMDIMCGLEAQVDELLYREELNRLKPYFDSGEVKYQDGLLKIANTARNKLRLIASVFDEYLSSNTEKFSKAV